MIRTLTACALALSATIVAAPAAHAQTADVAAGATTLAPVDTCRLADTRTAQGFERLDEHTIRVRVAGRCGAADDSTAAALNAVSVNTRTAGFVSIYPSDIARPDISNINASILDTIANSAVVKLSADGHVDVYHSGTADIVVDLTATFRPATEPTSAGRYTPVAPTRIIDTRTSGQRGAGALGVPTNTVVPAGAAAVVATVTAVNATGPGYVTAWPSGEPQPNTSTLNTDFLNRTRAVTAIISNTDGSSGLDVYRSVTSDVVIDIVGYFTGDNAPADTNGMFVPESPRRVTDTRTTNGPIHPRGTIELRPATSSAAALLNIAATDNTDNGYLTAWPARTARPATSNLNVAWRTPVAAMAIVGLSQHGAALYSGIGTQVVVDVAGRFTGPETVATGDAAPNTANGDIPRVLFVSDSSLAGIRWTGSLNYLQGARFDARLESCRRLSGVSCRGREGYAPVTAATDVRRAGGGFDTLVIATGYNDYSGTFQRGFEQVMNAARANGTRQVVWLTYREPVGYNSPAGASNAATFAANNVTLRNNAASGLWPELVVADWNTHTAPAARRGWLTSDGVHVTAQGAPQAAMYVSRYLAFLDRRACPAGIGGVTVPAGWCANPDTY
ncbi:MAG: hypothetical protein ABJH68_02665 [Ilumatobacter sp.]|uniref:hypothetical protein n=1 Tax=Ilumatobacter sp. TaxID=1967498 RepID=UPI00329A7BB9